MFISWIIKIILSDIDSYICFGNVSWHICLVLNFDMAKHPHPAVATATGLVPNCDTLWYMLLTVVCGTFIFYWCIRYWYCWYMPAMPAVWYILDTGLLGYVLIMKLLPHESNHYHLTLLSLSIQTLPSPISPVFSRRQSCCIRILYNSITLHHSWKSCIALIKLFLLHVFF